MAKVMGAVGQVHNIKEISMRKLNKCVQSDQTL